MLNYQFVKAVKMRKLVLLIIGIFIGYVAHAESYKIGNNQETIQVQKSEENADTPELEKPDVNIMSYNVLYYLLYKFNVEESGYTDQTIKKTPTKEELLRKAEDYGSDAVNSFRQNLEYLQISPK